MSEKRTKFASGGRIKGRGRRGSGNPNLPSGEGYAKWAEPNTSTQAYDPAQRIARAKDDDKGTAPSVSTPAPTPAAEQVSTEPSKEQTITDGKTSVTSTKPKYIPGEPGAHEPNDVSAMARRAYYQQHGVYPPCINPDCKSYGKPHPNCLCFGPSSSQEGWAKMSGGGVVERFCNKKQAHNPNCEYFQDGGEVPNSQQPQIQLPDDTEATVGHAAVEHGLLGLLRDVGHRKLQDHKKHTETLKNQYDPQKMAGSALTGTISPNRLEPIMERLADPMAQKEPSSEAFRNSVDYLSSVTRGHNTLDNHVKSLFGNEEFPDQMEPEKEDRENLKKHLNEIQENPSKALEIGGMLGHYLPEHSSSIAAHSANAMNYLNSLKPIQAQQGPLDMISPVDKMAEQKYNRALDLANKPLMALHSAKEGTLQHQDVETLMKLFPGLHKSMVKKIGEQLIEAKQNGIEIPHKQRHSVSLLIGRPLDSSFTPQSMQAIIKANAGAQMPQTQNNQGKPKKASGVELKQINQVNEMSETPTQKRISNGKG